MPLRIELRDRSGKVFGGVGESWDSIEGMWPDLSFDTFPLLAGVDRDDDTMFNRLQLGPVAAELERLLADSPPRRREMITEMIKLCRLGSQLPAPQLWFFGD
ncbi:MAG: hypothetical protein ACRDZ7_01385 [Acidimicrobiia bacterium]